MVFSPLSYGAAAAHFLTGERGADDLVPIDPYELFPLARFPHEAVAGLWLLLDDLDRSHSVSQGLSTQEAAVWHGIMHRREPDPANAAYWFRRAGRHPIFPSLHRAAAAAGYPVPGTEWDPFAWIEYWERARRLPGSEENRVALAVQRVEWEILFDHCARSGK